MQQRVIVHVCQGPYDVVNVGWPLWLWREPEVGNVPDYPPSVGGWIDPRKLEDE